MSRAVGGEEATGGQESKSPEENEYYDPTREDNSKGRKEKRLALWEEHL